MVTFCSARGLICCNHIRRRPSCCCAGHANLNELLTVYPTEQNDIAAGRLRRIARSDAVVVMLKAWKIAPLLILSIALRGAEVRFNRDIRPLLSDRCFACHGPDKGTRKAKLRLDVPESAFGPRADESEHAIVPRKPDKSLLITRIFSTDPD